MLDNEARWFQASFYRERPRSLLDGWVLRLVGIGAALVGHRAECAADHSVPAPRPPSLDGLRLPGDHAAHTLEAIVGAMIPGPRDDPDGAPGAVQAGAALMLTHAHLLPSTPAGGVPSGALTAWRYGLTVIMDVLAVLSGGRRFRSLAFDHRVRLLDRVYRACPLLLEGVSLLAGAAFCGGLLNRAGDEYLGIPGVVDSNPPAPNIPVPPAATTDGHLP